MRDWIRLGALWLMAAALLATAGGPGTPPASAGAATGTIAYVAAGGQEIRLIEPDGTGDRLLWAVPNPELNYKVSDIDWNPAASELAFASSHESACSIYESDLYAIRPNGSGLRRVTNAPACASLASYPQGAVTVGVNNAGGGGPYFVYVQGAPSIQMVIVPDGSTATVTFPNVADLGDDVQVAVVIEGLERWIAPIAAADVQPGQTVHAGTIVIGGAGITRYGAWVPSWHRDGTRLGFILGDCAGLWQISAQPGLARLGDPLLQTNAFGCVLDWGPTPATANQLLYYSYLDNGIYQVTEGSNSTGTRLVETDSAELVIDVQWLPDGSGFLYTKTGGFLENANLYEYSFTLDTSLPVTEFTNEFARDISISPDGQTIVLERAPTRTGDEADLWLLDRDGENPRLLVEDATLPSWSAQAPASPRQLYLPAVVR